MRVGALVAVVIADVVLKELARRLPEAVARFSFSTPVGVIGFAPSVNDVLAFSLPIPNAWIWPIGWVVVLALVLHLIRFRRLPQLPTPNSKLPMIAILFGALSNLTDRTFRGGVTDYLALTDQFPAFNLADLLIMGGVGIWIWRSR